MAGVVHVPWYATGFRGDQLERELGEIAAIALRYGATEYAVHRGREDAYKFLQLAHFESKRDWGRYWEGPEFIDFRVRTSSWFQVPVLYSWFELTAHGEGAAAGNGAVGRGVGVAP